MGQTHEFPDDFFNHVSKSMPEFVIGTRVRVTCVLGMPGKRAFWTGREGVIVQKELTQGGVWHGRMQYLVDVKGVGLTYFQAESLEAIVPDGAKPGSWATCPWRPPV